MSNLVKKSYPLRCCKISHMIGSEYCFLLTTSCCRACCCRNCHCHGACAACVNHAVGDNSCHRCIKRMTLDSCAGQWNIAVCVRHTCFAAIDAFVVIIVVAGWVLSWYSGWPHNALVTFVGKAVLWLWGWSPQPFLLGLRGSSCERFSASRLSVDHVHCNRWWL